MSVSSSELAAHLDTLLEAAAFTDYGPNGLQVAGAAEVATLATATTASLAACRAATAAGAQALLVHHGVLWGGLQPITGMLRARLATLFAGDCALLAYHLPLDAHPEWGNNAWLARALGLSTTGSFAPARGRDIGLLATCPEPRPIAELQHALAERLDHEVIHCPGGARSVERIGIVSGGGQNFLAAAAAAGCQVLITGETSEQTWHEAAELGIHCLAAGHHATECHAVHELGAATAASFGIAHVDVDQPNPL